MGKKIHYLSNIDADKRTGICSHCGNVSLKKCGKNWQCRVSYNARKRGYKVTNIKNFREQPSECEICGKDKRLVVDHDHKLNIFRGWICSSCNTGLGSFFDNKQSLENAIKYLKR